MISARPHRILCVIAALLSSTIAQAGIGDIDPAYGLHGILTNRGNLNTMTSMPDGRVVAAAYEDSALDLYMSDVNGQPDPAFAPDGHLSVPIVLGSPFDAGLGTAAAVSPEGNLYFAIDPNGQTSAKLLRVSSAGVLDSGFGANGVVSFAAPNVSTASAGAEILSIAPLANGQVAVLVGYFDSIYDCANDLRVFRLTSSGVVELEYDHAALLFAAGACGEFGGVTLAALGNGFLSLVTGDAPTLFDATGRVVTMHLDQAGIAGNAVSLSPEAAGGNVYVAGPGAFMSSGCALSRLLPDMTHTYIDGDEDDSLEVDFSSVPDAPGPVRACKILGNGPTGMVYVEALLHGVDGRTMVAIARVRVRGVYYPDVDRRFGNNGIAVLGTEAPFGLFAEQADGSLLLSHGGYAGDPAQGGDAVIKLLGLNLPSSGMIFLEALPYPVAVMQGSSTRVSVRRALGSSGPVTATYVVTARQDGPPISYSPVRSLTLTWANGEQGSRSAEAISAKDAVGHYDVDSTSIVGAVFFYRPRGILGHPRPTVWWPGRHSSQRWRDIG